MGMKPCALQAAASGLIPSTAWLPGTLLGVTLTHSKEPASNNLCHHSVTRTPMPQIILSTEMDKEAKKKYPKPPI